MTPGGIDTKLRDYRDRLAAGDVEEFNERLEQEITSLSLQDIRDELIAKFEREKEHLKLVISAVSAFHQTQKAGGYESGYRFAFTEPLAERNMVGESEVANGDVLLAKTDGQNLYTTVIECKSGRHDGAAWIGELKDIEQVLETQQYRSILTRQLGEEQRDLQRIQYVLLGRLSQVHAINFDNLEEEFDIPSNFAFWGFDYGDQTMVHVGGDVEDQDLARVIQSSVDTMKVEAPIKYTFGDHPLIQLKTLIEEIIDEKQTTGDDYPFEFNRREFMERFDSELQIGFEEETRRRLVNQKVDSLLDTGLKCGIFVDSPNRLSSARDYRILFRGAKAEVAAEAADTKYFEWAAKQKRKARAFQEVRTEFSPNQTRLFDERWQEGADGDREVGDEELDEGVERNDDNPD